MNSLVSPSGLVAGICLAVGASLLSPMTAFAAATLKIVEGSHEFQTFETAVTVDVPQPLFLRWTTDQPAAGGTWKVTVAGAPGQIVAQGESGPAPVAGHFLDFTIPASGPQAFLKTTPTASPVVYDVAISPHDASGDPLGATSPVVTVTQVKSGPPVPIHFGRSAVFPDIALVHYAESIGQVPNTQILFANATITVRAVNNGKGKTDPFRLSISDSNVLMRQTDNAASVGVLGPGQVSPPITLHLTAMLPPPKSQTPQFVQMGEWKQRYRDDCGVDLRAQMDWSGPVAQAPIGDHAEAYLYQGFGDSKPWQDGRPVSNAVLCDDKTCMNLNKVARSIHSQIGCKVVGYAFYVGDRESGPRGVFGAFGKARTSVRPPETDFSPDTEMQIASTSKVLTGLTAMRVMNGKLDSLAYPFLPSNWSLPKDTPKVTQPVRSITLREFVSQTSGLQQYYAAASGQDFAGLQAFFTQSISNPGAPYFCPGPPSASTPGNTTINLPNPIITNKTPCYTDTNFGIMRLLLPRFNGETSNDPMTLANDYVALVQANVFAPVGVQGPSCAPPANPSAYAVPHVFPGDVADDWGPLTASCGDWGWYVSVRDYAKVLISLNSADHRILTDCQFNDMETNPASHPVGWDIVSDGAGHRWLEKNGADGTGNGSLQTTSVGIFGGHSGCPTKFTSPMPGVAAVLFVNSDMPGLPANSGAWSVLLTALQSAASPKP